MLQKTTVPFGAVNVRMPSSGMRFSSSSVGRVVVAERSPRPGVGVASSGRASGDVLERPRACVDVHEVEERLQEVLVVEVTVPALRGDPVGVRGLRHRVPEVDVLELRPQAEVRVRDVEHAVGRAGREPGVVEPELDAVALEPNDELLPGSNTEGLAVTRQRGLGVGDEARGLFLDRAPRVWIRDQLGERDDAIALDGELGDDALLHVVERRPRVGEVAAARPIRENPVVKRVRRTHAPLFERRRDVVDPRSETCLRPVHGGLTLPHVLEPAPREPVRAFVLYRDSPLRREALRAPAGDPSRYSLYGLDELARAGFELHHDLEPQFEPGTRANAAARVLDRTVRLGGGYSGDFARVLASLSELNRSAVVYSTVDTVGIPLALLGRLGRVKPPVVYAAIGLPERLEQLRGPAARRLFAGAFRRLHTIVAYGWGQVEELRALARLHGPRIEFVVFGVDPEQLLT